LDTITTTTMQDQAGIMKGSIETLDFDIITAGGTIITATNQSSIKSTAHTRIKRIAIPQALNTADTNTPLKAIPTESLSN